MTPSKSSCPAKRDRVRDGEPSFPRAHTSRRRRSNVRVFVPSFFPSYLPDLRKAMRSAISSTETLSRYRRSSVKAPSIASIRFPHEIQPAQLPPFEEGRACQASHGNDHRLGEQRTLFEKNRITCIPRLDNSIRIDDIRQQLLRGLVTVHPRYRDQRLSLRCQCGDSSHTPVGMSRVPDPYPPSW